MADLSITNVMQVSISEPQAGLGEYNTSNLGILTREAPEESFGDDGYKIYKEPGEVATDFGSDSVTYKMALAVFSQKKNILSGRGSLIVMPMLEETDAVIEQQLFTFSATPAEGTFKVNFAADVTAAIAYNADAATLQTAIRTLTGLEAATVAKPDATHFTVTMTGYAGNAPLCTISENSMQSATPVNVDVAVTQAVAGVAADDGETVADAITRTKSLVQYFGVMVAEIIEGDELDDAAVVIETLSKIAFWPSKDEDSVQTGGDLDHFRSRNQHQNRGLLYIGAADDTKTLIMGASYAGRALSTNFDGVRTTQTMHLKDLTSVDADSAIGETLAAQAKAAGADIYASIQGIAKTLTSGKNQFFDQVYNKLWFKGRIEVDGFNALAQTDTKIPQTEDGIEAMTGAYGLVCEQAVVNGYIAPGEWNGAIPFGDPELFLANIRQKGYYVFSSPIAKQSQSARADRQAPLAQIAIKEAGAEHSGQVVINIQP